MKRLSEWNQVRAGAVGILLVAVLLVGLLNIGKITTAVTGTAYSAAFSEAGGLRSGMDVRVSGLTVGEVTGVQLDGDHVRVDFTADDVQLGKGTRAAVKTENALGRMFLELFPKGPGELDSEIPVERTEAPYSLTDAVSGLTRTTEQIDTQQLSRSLNTLATTFSDTPPELRAALKGMSKFSRTISSRDQALQDLFEHAQSVTGVLAERNAQIVQLLSDGNALLRMLESRREAIRGMIVNVTTATEALSGFVTDNRGTLKPALDELQETLRILNGQLDNLRKVVGLLGGYGRQLGEALGGGPWFYGYLQGLVPSNIAPLLPALFGVGDAPNYGQPPPPPKQPPVVANQAKPTGDPWEPEPGQLKNPRVEAPR